MKRLLYRCLIAAHPPAFRRQFGPEMELIFDESDGPARLFVDGVVSILRQWLFRTKLWIIPVSAIGAVIPFLIGGYFLRLTENLFFFTAPNPESFIVVTALIALMAISLTLALSIAWFRYSRRRRSPARRA
jgi:hypothetical protein